MRNGLIGLAVIGAIAIGTSGAAVAQVQSCPPGQILQAGVCQVATMPGAPGAAPSTVPRANTTSTATVAPSTAPPAGTTATAAPAGAVSGSSAAPVISPTAGTAAAEKTEACPAGLALYNHGCYPAHDAATAMVR